MNTHLPRWVRWCAAAVVVAAIAAAAPAHANVDEPPLDPPLAPFAMERSASLPERPWDAGHRGIDVRATVAQSVLAPGDGVVAFAGMVVDRPVLTVLLDDGRLSSVEPVSSDLARGAVVARGQVVGEVSAHRDHCALATCVHWGVRRGDAYLDPLDLLAGLGPIRLLSVR